MTQQTARRWVTGKSTTTGYIIRSYWGARRLLSGGEREQPLGQGGGGKRRGTSSLCALKHHTLKITFNIKDHPSSLVLVS